MPKDRLKQAMDRSLASVCMDEAQKQQIMIRARRQEERSDAPKPKKMQAAVILAVLVMMSFSVVAAQQIGWISWKGEFVPAEPVFATPAPTPEEMSEKELLRARARELVRETPEGEYWKASYAGTSYGRLLAGDESLRSLDELRERTAHLGLKVPVEPEGYEAKEIRLQFDHEQIEPESEPYCEEMIDGIILSKYRLLSMTGIMGYDVTMEDGNGNILTIHASIQAGEEGMDNMLFPVSEGTSYQPLTVEGFDRALQIRTPDSFLTALERRRETREKDGACRQWAEYYQIDSKVKQDIEGLWN